MLKNWAFATHFRQWWDNSDLEDHPPGEKIECLFESGSGSVWLEKRKDGKEQIAIWNNEDWKRYSVVKTDHEANWRPNVPNG